MAGVAGVGVVAGAVVVDVPPFPPRGAASASPRVMTSPRVVVALEPALAVVVEEVEAEAAEVGSPRPRPLVRGPCVRIRLYCWVDAACLGVEFRG